MNRSLAVFAVLLFAISFVSAQGTQDYSAGCLGMMGGAYGYGLGFIFGWIFMILVTIAVVLLIIWLIKQINNNGGKRR